MALDCIASSRSDPSNRVREGKEVFYNYRQRTATFSRDREGRHVQADRQAGGGSYAGDGAEQKWRGAGAARWSAAVDQAAEDQMEQVEGGHGLLYTLGSDREEDGLSVAEDGSVLGAE